MLRMMQYLSELIHAQLEYKKPGNIPEGILLEELIQIAHKSHMDYLILGALLKTDLTDEEKSRIRPFVLKSTLNTFAQICCLREIEENFEEREIYHLVLKGSVLKQLFPAPEMREMSDIDVMIYDDNLERVKKVVLEMGFTLLKSVKHHDIYVKAPCLVLEVHNALYDKNVDKNQYEYFQSKKKIVAKDGKRYTMQFGKEDFYVYLIAHMAKHFYETGCGIRNVLDVYWYRHIYESTWDESIIRDELQKCGLTVFEKRIHILSQVWLGGQIPDPYSKALFGYMLDCGIYGKGENGVWGQFAKQNHNSSKNYKTYAKRWYYFPPLSYMENEYSWLKKFPFMIIVAWVVRAGHGLFSKGGREKRNMLLNLKSEDVCTIYDIYKGMQLDFKK